MNMEIYIYRPNKSKYLINNMGMPSVHGLFISFMIYYYYKFNNKVLLLLMIIADIIIGTLKIIYKEHTLIQYIIGNIIGLFLSFLILKLIKNLCLEC